ncbi:Chromosome-associated kinesin KIF4, partial [Stegodyphus mimosarum]
MADCAVRVAVRARPPLNEKSGISMNFLPEPPSIVIHDRSFTYDYVFTPDKSNQDIYDTAVADKLQYIFEGYNLTILAYGQTGSGKTYTMGTDYASRKTAKFSELGIIPR